VAMVFAVVGSGCGNGNGNGEIEATGRTSSALTYPLPSASYSITLQTPKGVSTQDVALAATNYIEIDGLGGQVIRSNASLLSTITSTGAGGVQVDAAATAGNIWAQQKAALLPGATAKGNIYTNSPAIGLGATIGGQIVTNAVYTPPNVTSWAVTFPAGTVSDLEVFGGTTSTQVPGRFGNTQVDATATLKLSSGAYYFESLTLLPLSTIMIDQTKGPVFLYVHNALSYSGTVVSTSGDFPDLLLGYFGVPPVTLSSPFLGTFISTFGATTLGDFVPPHIGAFFAPTITVSTGAVVVFRSPANLLVAAPPAGGMSACAAGIRPRDDLTGEKQADQYQADVARYCTSPSLSPCLAYIVGRANVDYTAAAAQLVSQSITPAQYLAYVRDREGKVEQAKGNATFASAVCAGPDADDDWIPDSQDTCANTPALTATTSSGCPITTLPTAPSAADVAAVLGNMRVIANPFCNGAGVPSVVSGAAIWQTAHPEDGLFIVSTSVQNQPTGCTVWYSFEFRVLDPTGAPIGVPIDVVYNSQNEAVATVGNLAGMPSVPADYIQFVAKPGDPGTRAQLAALAGQRISVSFRVQAMNGSGYRGGWSEWRTPTESDCLHLGVFCQ
jgi:hypothetical protein